MKAIDAVAHILREEGIKYLSCFPAHPLIDAVVDAGIQPIMTRTERVAVNMADGYVRVTNGRNLMACGVQSHAGIENTFAGVAQAYADSSPILLLPLGCSERERGVPPNFEAVPAYASVTKWAERISSAERVTELLRRAFTRLRMGQPGPVLIEIPSDVVEADAGDAARTYRPARVSRSAADPTDVRRAASMLLEAKRPLIHVGQGVLYAGATDELRELAELLGAPVVTTMAGKSAFPEDHPLSAGYWGRTMTKAAALLMREADLVFGIGCSFGKTLLAMPLPANKSIIHATLDDQHINIHFPADAVLAGDAQLVLQQMIDEIERQAGGTPADAQNPIADIGSLKGEWLKEWMPRLTSDEVPINPYRVIWELMQAVPPAEAIVTHDAGYPRDQTAPFYVSTTPRGYLGWGHTTQLGSSLGLAMGARLAAPDKLAVNLMGDAAFGMVGMDLETAVRHRIPILTLLLNNSALCGYEKHMPSAIEKHNLKTISGEYAQVAKGLGAFTERVEQPAEIRPSIERARKAIADGSPALLEFITCEELALSMY